MDVTNQVRAFRTQRGLSGAELAERVGVSRQTIHAIESGAYTPNTTVALRLARELGIGVEDLFRLADAPEAPPLEASLIGGDVSAGTPLRLCQVGGRTIAAPWSPEPFALPLADAEAISPPQRGSVRIAPLQRIQPNEDRLLVAGCDPAVSLLAEHLRRTANVELIAVPSSSRQALEWLRAGLVHVAGTHLAKAAARLPTGCRAFTLAEWEEGLVVASGNPNNLRAIADLARRGIRIVNREPGAGSRALLETALADAGVSPSEVAGYERIAPGHLAAAWTVRRGEADCCIAPRVAARVFGLDFVPLASERYELAVAEQWLELRPVHALLEALQRPALRRAFEALGGYDAAQMGSEAS